MKTFIARQPIFDAAEQVIAYELLFRDGLQDAFPAGMDPDLASSRVIADSLFLLGLDTMTAGKPAFINVTQELLLGDYVTLLPPELVVIEILETVEPTVEVIAACQRLVDAGYRLALDDFTYAPKFEPLMELAAIIKVDFLATPPDQRADLAARVHTTKVQMLAEKVETRDDFDAAVAMGYGLFQGYFFSKPVVLEQQSVPEFKMHYLELLREIHCHELDLDALDAIIKRELSLSYRLLRHVNSPLLRSRTEICSIRHALVMLGNREVRKWVSFMALTGMGEDKPQELLVHALIRARFCEAHAGLIGNPGRADELFLMGLFSLLDAIVDRPLVEVVAELPIEGDIKAALGGEEGPLRDVLELAIAYERADWDRLAELASRLGGDVHDAPRVYAQALTWARDSFCSA